VCVCVFFRFRSVPKHAFFENDPLSLPCPFTLHTHTHTAPSPSPLHLLHLLRKTHKKEVPPFDLPSTRKGTYTHRPTHTPTHPKKSRLLVEVERARAVSYLCPPVRWKRHPRYVGVSVCMCVCIWKKSRARACA
jgi:hypothetical protein